MSQPVIVFDLDGTLIDTAPDLAGTLNAILAREGIEPVPYEQVRETIGHGSKAMLTRALTLRRQDAGPDRIERLFRDFLDHYSDHIADRSQPFPGLETALDDLSREGFRLAVCTNKLEWLSRKLLDALDLSRRFEFVCGQDTFGVMKPDPHVLRQTVTRAGGEIGRAIMVGDSITDIRTARAAGIPVIAVDFGYTDTPVTELAPDRVISRYDDLLGAIRAFPFI
jgi:phosphoglycolate phosphatase